MVLWCSRKQSCVAQSIVITEYVVACMAAKEAMCLCKLFVDCLLYGVNRLMHTDNRQEQQYSFYYSHMPKRLHNTYNDDYNDLGWCIYTS